jgi:hypothetical protein
VPGVNIEGSNNGATVHLEINAGDAPVKISTSAQTGSSHNGLKVGYGSSADVHGNYSISTTGSATATVGAFAGGTITLTDGKVENIKTTSSATGNDRGSGFAALHAKDAGSKIAATDVEAIAKNDSPTVGSDIVFVYGANSLGGGLALVKGGTITATSNLASLNRRVYAASAETNGHTIADGVTVSTDGGPRNHPAVANTGLADIYGGTIDVKYVWTANAPNVGAGLYSNGAFAAGASPILSSINAAKTRITSTGFGVFLQSNGGTETNGLQASTNILNVGSYTSNVVAANIYELTINSDRSGLVATARNRTITSVDSAITATKSTTQTNEAGAYVIGGGQITLTDTCNCVAPSNSYDPASSSPTGFDFNATPYRGGNTITATQSHGIYASGSNSLVQAFGTAHTNIESMANAKHGAFATSSGKIDLTNTDIKTNGTGFYGGYVSAGGMLWLKDSVVSTVGNNADGVRIDGAASSAQTFNTNRITTSGTRAC